MANEVLPRNVELQARFEAELGMSLRQVGLKIGLPERYFTDEHNIAWACQIAAITYTCALLMQYFHLIYLDDLSREGDAYPEDLVWAFAADEEECEIPYWAALVLLLFFSSLTTKGLDRYQEWLPDYLERSKAKWGFDGIPEKPAKRPEKKLPI